MSRSISIVEYKVEQSLFFLHQIERAGLDFFAVQCLTDAFASACRSITLAVQAVVSDVPGFREWYAAKQVNLRDNRLAKFFNSYRVASVHIGDTVVRGGVYMPGEKCEPILKYYFMPIPEVDEVPTNDVVSSCRTYFVTLLELVYDLMSEFRYELDDRWHYSEDNFRKMGKSLEDAIAELGFPRDWLDAASDLGESEKWRVLRKTQAIGCQLNSVFESYLDKTIAGPDD